MTGPSLGRLWAITRREYLLRVKNKWFLVTTFGFPLLMFALAFLPGLLVGMSGQAPLRVGVVDRAGLAGTELPVLLAHQDSGIQAETISLSEAATREELAASLRSSDRDAYLVLEPGVLQGDGVTVLSRTGISELRQHALREAVRQAVVQAGLRDAGLSTEEAESVYRAGRVDLRVSRVDDAGSRQQEVFGVIALVATFVLYMMFIIYGQMITRGVVEEKSSDIAEILVATVRPWELMLGKVLGIGGMGLTQIAIWAVAGGFVLLYGAAASAPALAAMGVDLGSLSFPFLRIGLAFLVFFLLGYFLYASVFAAVGATVGDEQEIQQVAFFPMLLIIVPFILAITAVEAGSFDTPWMVGGSYFPFFTPILMLVRFTMGAAAGWEVGVSLVLMVAAILGTAWLAGRIYRVGILMKGKRPTLPELMRWVRYG